VKYTEKNPATTVVVIDKVDTDNWGIAGESVTLRRKKVSESELTDITHRKIEL
jgi:phenylpyruvate tautomerase PptA (4-oxalocrotonate tautomerase family)